MQPETPATQKEKNDASKTVCVRNLSFDVQRAEMYVLIFLVVLVDYYRVNFFNFKCFSVKVFSKIVEKLLMSVCMWMLSLQPQKQQKRQVFWPCIVFTNHFRTANRIPWIVVLLETILFLYSMGKIWMCWFYCNVFLIPSIFYNIYWCLIIETNCNPIFSCGWGFIVIVVKGTVWNMVLFKYIPIIIGI